MRLDLQRAADPEERAGVVAQPVRRVTQTRCRVGRVGVRAHGELEVAMRLPQQAFTEARATELQHQLEIVLEAQRDDALEAAHGPGAIAQLEEHFAHPGERILVIGIERQRGVEAPARPGELLHCHPGIGGADMEFD